VTIVGNDRPQRKHTEDTHPAYCDPNQLYNLKADPGEKHNLYGQPGYEEVQAQMHADLKAVLEGFPHAFGEFKVVAEPSGTN
jgi:hypothetical protein